MEIVKRCVKCGRIIPLSMKVCTYCGSRQLNIEKTEEITSKGISKKSKKILHPVVG